MGELQRIASVIAARAEAAWLMGDLARCAAEARLGFDVAVAHENPWALGQLAIWLWRAGQLSTCPPNVALPFALQIGGDWAAAAAAWERLGCPYEHALALTDGDEAAQRRALDMFRGLGASTAAELVLCILRDAGARGLPRGPRATTSANPYSLTERQLEILELLAEGLRTAQIAERLSITPKTLEHHVSAVFAKLGVHTRAEAVSIVLRQRWTGKAHHDD
jgi:DNA-binding CsgD family transcriptional regulator